MAWELDDLFEKEFTSMMRGLKVRNGLIPLSAVSFGNELESQFSVTAIDKVLIDGIKDEYYSKLNKQVVGVWSRPDLKRRTFDSNGEFIKKDGNYVLEDVTVPSGCLAISADIPIGVKTRYKPEENFAFVDKVYNTALGGSKFIYIIPKKYLYRVNQSCISISWNKFTRNFYAQTSLATKWGSYLFLTVSPYKPSREGKASRVLTVGTDPDDLIEISKKIIQYLISSGQCFNPADCDVSGGSRVKVQNTAFQDYPSDLDTYTLCNEMPLDNEVDTNYSFGE